MVSLSAKALRYTRPKHVLAYGRERLSLATWRLTNLANSYTSRLLRIGGMSPVGSKPFYSRQQHVERVVRISELIRSKFFSLLSAKKTKDLASQHDFGRMPFVHYLEIFLKKKAAFQFSQQPFQAQHMRACGLDPELVSAATLLHATAQLSISKRSISDSANLRMGLHSSAQIARLVYYADKITGFIEDIILGFKLGYFEGGADVPIAESGLPQVFIEAFSLNVALIKRIKICSRSEFNGVVVEIAENFLNTVSSAKTPYSTMQDFEHLIFDLNQKLRKGIMEPIIFVKQREDLGFNHLCSQIFTPVINHLLQKHHDNKQAVIEALMGMDEADLINLALSLGLNREVAIYNRRLSDIQSRWKTAN